MTKHRNNGLRKVCGCGRTKWAKCAHGWHLNFQWAGIPYRLSVDREVGEHVGPKADAKAKADGIRSAIRAGTFRQAAPEAPTPDVLTFEAFAKLWIERARDGQVKRPANDWACVRSLGKVAVHDAATLNESPIGRITEDDLERVLAVLRRTKAASTMNKYLQTIKALEKWGRRKGYLSRPWLSEFTSLKREKHARRDRRLVPDELTPEGKVKTPGEERRLLAACTPWLQRLVIAALETGCRRGELLSLQWADVDLPRHELTIRAEKAKDGDTRTLPISQRLASVLEMVRLDPAGEEHGPEAYVLGDAVGGQVADPKKAWATACKRAKITGLHFHDLRHEAGSRLLEAGWPLHHLQEMLGHADLKQTSTYLNVTRTGLQESMRKYGTGLQNLANEPATEPPPFSNDATIDDRKALVN